MSAAEEKPSAGAQLTLRAARNADEAWLRELRNDPDVRAASRSKARVAEGEHAQWLADVLANPDRRLLVGELGGEPVGQVRLDRLGGLRFEISLALKPGFRGRGLSTRLIALAIGNLRESDPGSSVEAHVHPENRRSLAAFEAAGFRRVDGAPGDDFLLLARSTR